MTNAYLLCRIADTIEDDPAIPAPETWALLQRLTAVVRGVEDAAPLGQELARRLSAGTLPAEREQASNLERVIRVTLALGEPRAAVQRCIELMSHGMHHFQRTVSLAGLPRSSDLDSYCYYVAGVVGEMLTELFCRYSPVIAGERDRLSALAVSFAQGLQMTNILKDFWEDRSRGATWLPQDLFAGHGVQLATLTPQNADARFQAGLRELVAVAHAHLHDAGVHPADPRKRGRHPALLSLGHRTRRAHAAQDRGQPAVHPRSAGQGVAQVGGPDAVVHEFGGAQRSPA